MSFTNQNLTWFRVWPFASSGNQPVDLSISAQSGMSGFLLPSQ